MLRYTVVFMMMVALPLGTFAHASSPGWLEETLYGSGKINAVVAVVAVILVGLVIWLIRMDRRLARMEREVERGEQGS